MESADNFYSRLVAWLKILLPLAALALLSTLFLFAKGRGGDGELPFAEIEAIARASRLANPTFAGVDAEGATYAVSADEARPLAGGKPGFTIEGIVARLTALDGSLVDLSAGTGEVDSVDRVLKLTDLVRLSTSSGYEMETLTLVAELSVGRITSEGPIAIRAPFGEMTAGALLIDQGSEGGGKQMVFNKGVRLIYLPSQ